MRKLSLISFAFAAAALLAQAAHADQLADIKQKGTLVCGTLGTAEPFSFPNPQTRETQGYDVDFCAAVAKALGVKLELKLISVPARIPELMQGRVDVLAANLGYTPERAQQIAFSDSYFVSNQMVAARRADKLKTAGGPGRQTRRRREGLDVRSGRAQVHPERADRDVSRTRRRSSWRCSKARWTAS